MLPTERAALQLERFVGLVRRLKKSESPYWQEKLREVDPDGLHGIEDITRLPFTVKSELRDTYPFGMLAVPLEETIRIHASSGTQGKPTVVAYTEADIDLFAEVNARSIACARRRTGRRRARCLRLRTVHRWSRPSLRRRATGGHRRTRVGRKRRVPGPDAGRSGSGRTGLHPFVRHAAGRESRG